MRLRRKSKQAQTSHVHKVLMPFTVAKSRLDKPKHRRLECSPARFRFNYCVFGNEASHGRHSHSYGVVNTVSRRKQRQRELRQDKFRDTTTNLFERLGDRLEGKGRAILYGLGALLLVAALVGTYRAYTGRKTSEGRLALGEAIEIQEARVEASPTPQPSPQTQTPEPTFLTETARAEAANKKFQEVVDKHPDPHRSIARYFIATNNLVLDRNKGVAELEALTKSGEDEVAASAKFALAQAYEADAKYDQAANLYRELLTADDRAYSIETLNLRLAGIYEKQGKRKEAVDLLFVTIEKARKAQGADGKPAIQPLAVRDAATQLQKLDPTRYAQLPPEPASAIPFT